MTAKGNKLTFKLVESHTYRAIWSEEDVEYVGLCAEFPSLSYLAASKAEALNGIVDLVAATVEDMKESKEALPAKLIKEQSSAKQEEETRTVLVQNWEESERGWGVRADGYTIHIDEKQHRTYVDWYNKTFNNLSYVPDEYTRASGNPIFVQVPISLFNKIKKAMLAKRDGAHRDCIWGKSKHFDKEKTDLSKDLLFEETE